MTSDVITLRFVPTGATEYWLAGEAPNIGDVVQRDGAEWLVVDVRTDADEKTVATLRPVHEEARGLS